MFLRTFGHCSGDVKVPLHESYCTALYCSFLWSLDRVIAKKYYFINHGFHTIYKIESLDKIIILHSVTIDICCIVCMLTFIRNIAIQSTGKFYYRSTFTIYFSCRSHVVVCNGSILIFHTRLFIIAAQRN